MYLEFFGLREKPFNVTPDPRFIFFSAQHQVALSSLLYGVAQRKGFMELTGEVGAGKTTLCRAFLQELNGQRRVRTALVLNPQLSDLDLVRSILRDLGQPVSAESRLVLMDVLNRFLLRSAKHRINVVVIIDEAQHLSWESMEFIRMLSNLETEREKLLQIVLVGQPELRRRLEQPDLRQLRQRIGVRSHLGPLTIEDTGRYIFHRLSVAGSHGRVSFEPTAVDAVYQYSQGVPRVINTVCDMALLAAFVKRTYQVPEDLIQEAIEEIEGSPVR